MFIEALRDLLPHLDLEAFVWRMYFITGALFIVTSNETAPGLRDLSDGQCDADDIERKFAQFVAFAAAGMAAPAMIDHRPKSIGELTDRADAAKSAKAQ
jgi:hypothetical protein